MEVFFCISFQNFISMDEISVDEKISKYCGDELMLEDNVEPIGMIEFTILSLSVKL